MKKYLLLILLLICKFSFSQTAFVKKYLFAKQLGIISACKAKNDGVMVLFDLYPDTGGTGYYLMRCDENGDSLWTKRDINYIGYDLHLANDWGYYLKDFDVFRKMDSLGNIEWTFRPDILHDNIYDVTQTPDSNFFLLGVKDTISCCSPAIKHLYKYDIHGNRLWEKYYYGNYQQYGIQSTSDNGAVMYCIYSDSIGQHSMIMKINNNGDSLWTKTYTAIIGSLSCCPSNPITVFPNDDIAFIDNRFIYTALTKTDSQGNILNVDSFIGNSSLLQCINSGIDGSVLAIGYESQPDANIILLIQHFNQHYFENLEIGEHMTEEFGRFIYQTSDSSYYIVAQRDSGAVHEILLLKSSSAHNFYYSINELSTENFFEIFPNPTANSFKIKSSLSKEAFLLQIFNPLGKIVYSENHFGRDEYLIDPDLSPGIYFVRINDSEKNVVRKLVVE